MAVSLLALLCKEGTLRTLADKAASHEGRPFWAMLKEGALKSPPTRRQGKGLRCLLCSRLGDSFYWRLVGGKLNGTTHFGVPDSEKPFYLGGLIVF